MKILFVGLVILAVASAKPKREAPENEENPEGDGAASVIEQDSEADPEKGTYHFKYETSNHIDREEKGHIKKLDDGTSIQKVKGSYNYTAPSGEVIHMRYKSGLNGFEAQGDYVPEVPEIVKELVLYLLSLPPKPEKGQSRSAEKPETEESEDAEKNDDDENGDENEVAPPPPPPPAPKPKPAGRGVSPRRRPGKNPRN